MNNRNDENIPSIKPDLDQVEAYRSTQKTKQQAQPVTASAPSTAKKSSAMGILNAIILYSAVAGGGYWFYQQDVKADQALAAAESRIVDLERQLSATDEEMGESTVAMRAKLEGLIEKTDKLWSEMDKLWASAWRKNQSQIKELRSTTIKADNKAKTLDESIASNKVAIGELSDKQTAVAFNLNAISEQLDQAQSIRTDIDKLSNQLNSLETQSSSRDKQQIELATMVAELDTSVKMLIERVQSMSRTGNASSGSSGAQTAPAQ